MELVVMAVVAILVVFGIAEGARREQRKQHAIDGVWASAAEQLEGSFHAAENEGIFGLLSSDPRLLDANIDGVDVRVDTFTRERPSASYNNRMASNNRRVTYTRVRARSTAPREVSLKVYREGVFSGLARAVGFQDVHVGDEDFDGEFIVKASDEMFARAWLNATVRNRIARAGDYEFRLKRGVVVAEREGEEDDVKALVRAMKAVAGFSDGKHFVVRVFKKLAKRLGGKARKEENGWASLRADVDGIPISVDTIEHGTTHYNVAEATVVGVKLTPLVLTNDPHEFSSTLPAAEMSDLPEGYASWTPDPEKAGAQLTAEVKSSIDKLQPVKVRIDEERVMVYIVGICPPSARMERAVKLAARIAASAGIGPYR